MSPGSDMVLVTSDKEQERNDRQIDLDRRRAANTAQLRLTAVKRQTETCPARKALIRDPTAEKYRLPAPQKICHRLENERETDRQT